MNANTYNLSRRAALKVGTAGIASACVAQPNPRDAGATVTSLLETCLISGEPTSSSIILQARVSASPAKPGDIQVYTPGEAGAVQFEVSTSMSFETSIKTDWIDTDARVDYIARTQVADLEAYTDYFFRAWFRPDDATLRLQPEIGHFRTLRASTDRAPVSFVVFSCMSYELFYGLGLPLVRKGTWGRAAEGAIRERGYPAMDFIARSSPDFMVATGDTVYYDHPGANPELWARTVPEMRARWQYQFAVPSLRNALSSSATFFMKDDHDFRFDDADNSDGDLPSADQGRTVFQEQVPTAPDAPGYRTYRLNRHLQIWFVEGRDFRSPNEMPDGPEKSLWGARQIDWLERTLLESDADFKLVISPTPIIGPDLARKADNHTSEKGFQEEGARFIEFLKVNDLTRSTFILNGDRHWQYHSIHPTGVEEFSCGTVHRQNASLGIGPGDPRSTDPDGLIRQPYRQTVPGGGYMQIDVEPDRDGEVATLIIRFWSETGDLQYAIRKTGQQGLSE